MTKRFRKWLYDNPGDVLFWLAVIVCLVAMALATFCGCASRPPRRFDNGDRTTQVPTWKEVDEPDMAHPSIFDN